LAFDPPERKLALPRFFMENTGNKNHTDQPQAPPLTPQERNLISSHLGAEAARRRKANAQFVTVAVDGSECAGLALSGETEHVFEIEDGSELVEIRTVEQGQDVLLATHRVTYTESQGVAPSSATVFLKGRRKLRLDISPALAGEPGRALVKLHYTPPALGAWLGRQVSFWNWNKYAVAASVLLAAGWILGAVTGGVYWLPQLRSSASAQQLAEARWRAAEAKLHEGSLEFVSQQGLGSVKPRRTVPTYTLVPDDSIVRGPGGTEIPSVIVPSQPGLLRLDLPIGPEEARRSLRATLRLFLHKNTDLLSQRLLETKSASSTGTVAFWVPSTLLDGNHDYAVDLRLRNSSGGQEEVSSYPFHTVAEPN
jgi:hypothetical protein